MTSCLPLLAMLAVCLTGCLLYTDPVNTRPDVTLAPQAGAVFSRGGLATVVATGRDVDADALTYAWYDGPAPCGDAPPDQAWSAPGAQPSYTFQLPAGEVSSACVWVRVTDRHGASATASLQVSGTNHAPRATLQVQKPSAPNGFGRYDLYSHFRISAAASFDPDGDKLTRTWTLKPPTLATPTPTPVPCSPTTPDDLVVCFDAGAFAGDYKVAVTVSDGMESATAEVTLTVDPDYPACLARTEPPADASPLVLDPTEAKRFTVTSVLDDGAPWPAAVDGTAQGTPSFAWAVRRNGGAWQEIVGFQQLDSVTLPADSFGVGDHVELRVTVSDGLQTHLRLACDPGCPAGCPDTVVWQLEYR